MFQTNQINPFVNDDICDCDQRCQKCGKLKRQNEQIFPQPYPTYPYSPYQPINPPNPYQPWISYTTTTCTHQE